MGVHHQFSGPLLSKGLERSVQHGKAGEAAKLARGFIRALRPAISEESLLIYEMDERYTSVEAEGLLRESGVQHRIMAAIDRHEPLASA